MKILVAGNDKDTLALLETILKKLGHEVLSANNTLDTIQKFRLENPDLVILDSNKNNEEVECADRLRDIYLGDWLPIIFIISSENEASKKAILAGSDDYILKPFNEGRVIAKLKLMQKIHEMGLRINEDNRKFKILSAMDILTGVFNRGQFDKFIQEKITQASINNTRFALLSVDLDHFKVINDNLGHHIGDLLLKNVAKRIKQCLGIDDFMARMGSDEFIVILGEIENCDAAERVAQKILVALLPPHNLLNEDVHISCSIGISCYPVDGTTPEILIQNADIAMSYAKELGRNNYQLFLQELYEKRKNQVNLEDALKFAVDREELFLNYQPIYDLTTRQVVGMEALVCWQHPRLGLISPNIFIPLAEENGLIDSIGKWTFRSAFAQGAKWYLAGYHDFKLAINISPRHMLQKSLPGLFMELLNKTQVPPQVLEFELTETATISQTALAQSIIQDIHELGIGLSLDDFGTGHSSYIRLKRLPINTIKIDRAFIENITMNIKDVMIVKSIIALGKDLGMGIIAEGIETAEQLAILVENGCPQGQGFYLSKPLSVEQMTAILKQQEDAKKPE
jgi:diguanylate cyclase (GGDEF)-like protein